MIGLDTNVLLRLFVEDDPPKRPRAPLCRRRGGGRALLVNPVVLAEFAWTLARNYKIKRRQVHV